MTRELTWFERLAGVGNPGDRVLGNWTRRLALVWVAVTVPLVAVAGLWIDGRGPYLPYDQAVTLRNSYCAKGTTVTWIEYWLAEHLLTIFSGAPDAVNWLSDRFAGLPQTDSC